MHVGVNALFLIPGEVGGSQTYLCETLAALVRHPAAPRLTLFTNRENDAFLRARFPDCGCVPLGFAAVNRVSRIVREQVDLPRRVRRAGIDVLWSPGYTAPVCTRVPQVVTILDMQYRRFPQDLSRIARVTTDVLVRAAAARARGLITISEFARHEICALTGADAARITVTPLGVDPAFGRPSRVVAPLPTGAPYLLCVANTYPHKNVPTLVEAFDRLCDAIPHRLVLVGKPRRGEAAVARAVDACRGRERVVRLDGVEHEALVALYQGCDAFVFPSLYEGFGLPVAEAMLAGVPVVTADTAIAAEVGGAWVHRCAARDAGALAGAVRTALDEPPAARQRRLEGARAHAACLTWAATAAATLEALTGAAR